MLEIWLNDFHYGYILGILLQRKLSHPSESVIIDTIYKEFINADRLSYLSERQTEKEENS